MGFASAYLEKGALFPSFIKEVPRFNTGIIVVVPSYSEPDIKGLLDSLSLCSSPICHVEVIVVVNAPEAAGRENLLLNKKSVSDIISWKRDNPQSFFSLHVIEVPVGKIEGWGVGLARKTGMDEAVRRFDRIGKPDGIILNLDADCKVKENYFQAVHSEMASESDRQACSIYFEHPVTGNEFSDSVYSSIVLYELHLRYYFQGLIFAGFPNVHHTVGSAIAVKALHYAKAGGMNRRQAGEDFYFVQKLIPAGGYFNLNKTAVYPSPRSSFRVPFGTGPVISRLIADKSEVLLSYNFNAFRELKMLFSMIDMICQYGIDKTGFFYEGIPSGLKQFMNLEKWTSKISEIRANTSGLDSFRKRFFSWFNMFMIVKYLNYIHSGYMNKMPVAECATELLKNTANVEFSSEAPLDLLEYYRSLEKEY